MVSRTTWHPQTLKFVLLVYLVESQVATAGGFLMAQWASVAVKVTACGASQSFNSPLSKAVGSKAKTRGCVCPASD